MTIDTTTQKAVTEDVEEPFHIVTGDNSQGPTLDLGICVNEPFRQLVSERKLLNLWLLVVIRQNGRDIERKMAPLTRGLVHVSFSRAGQYTAHAMVVWDEGDPYYMKKYLLGKNSGGSFANDLFGYGDSEPYERFSGSVKYGSNKKYVGIERVDHVSVKPITVDANNFAKPMWRPRAAMLRWFSPDDDRDQCHSRKRTWMLLYNVPLTLPLHYLAKVIGLVLYGLGGFVYGLNVKPAWRPVRSGSLAVVFGNVKDKSAWFYKRETHYSYVLRPVWLRTTVVVAAIYVVVGTICWSSSFGAHTSGGAFLVALIALVCIAAGLGIAFGILYVLFAVLAKAGKNKFSKWLQEYKEQSARDEIQRFQHELVTMSCDKQGRPMTIQDLKRRHRFNPVVVYHSTKDRVCKPYAR